MRISLGIREWVIPRPLWGDVPLSCERLACSKMCLVVQEMCMQRRGYKGVSVGITLGEFYSACNRYWSSWDFGGGLGGGGPVFVFFRWGGGGCVNVLRYVGCGWKFVGCVGALVGDEGSCVGEVWLGGCVWLG